MPIRVVLYIALYLDTHKPDISTMEIKIQNDIKFCIYINDINKCIK